MRIAIDVSQIVHGTGVSFYTRNLVRNLARLDKNNDYLLLGYSLRLRKDLEDFSQKIRVINPGFSAKIFSLPPSLAEPLGNRFRFFPVEKIVGPIDVFHSSDWIQFPTLAARVTTIHDFGFWKYPQTAQSKISAVMKRRLALVKQEADLMIAVSQATAKDIMKILKVPRKKIRVIYEAPSEEFQKTKPEEIAETKKRFGLKNDYFLAVANLDPRKNLSRIIKAFLIFQKKKPKTSLVVAGKFGWGDRKRPGIGGWQSGVVFTGYLSNRELAALYAGAACLVYPSLYEGFGLPVLEAMRLGCPVVTSNLSSLPEVAGRAAVLVNPFDPEEIAVGIEKALARKEKLIRAGLRRARRFSWEKTARETIKVYREVYDYRR
jgi:glycosyltransferase involved in cell wall biosynthesis